MVVNNNIISMNFDTQKIYFSHPEETQKIYYWKQAMDI